MQNYWFKSSVSNLLYGKPALKHKLTKELCIFAEHGEVFYNNNNTFKVLIYRNNIYKAKKLSKIALTPVQDNTNQDEVVLTLNIDKLDFTLDVIGGLFDLNQQCKYVELLTS